VQDGRDTDAQKGSRDDAMEGRASSGRALHPPEPEAHGRAADHQPAWAASPLRKGPRAVGYQSAAGSPAFI